MIEEANINNADQDNEEENNLNIVDEQEILYEELLGPPRVDLLQVWLYAVWSIISGFCGSTVLLLSIYFFLQPAKAFDWLYPYVYISTVTMASLITSSINIIMFKIINPDKYKRWLKVLAQVYLLNIFQFWILILAYVFISFVNKSFLIYIFSVHIIFAMFGSSLFTEILSSYRYALLWVYWSFLWALTSILLTCVVFLVTSESTRNLYVLIVLLILINFVIITIKSIFEYLYYLYYSKTWMDQLWDIYYQIEEEENEIIAKAKKELQTIKK